MGSLVVVVVVAILINIVITAQPKKMPNKKVVLVVLGSGISHLKYKAAIQVKC